MLNDLHIICVTHDFGHSGDVSTSDVFRLPQGLFS
jgi:hypothetical protein